MSLSHVLTVVTFYCTYCNDHFFSCSLWKLAKNIVIQVPTDALVPRKHLVTMWNIVCMSQPWLQANQSKWGKIFDNQQHSRHLWMSFSVTAKRWPVTSLVVEMNGITTYWGEKISWKLDRQNANLERKSCFHWIQTWMVEEQEAKLLQRTHLTATHSMYLQYIQLSVNPMRDQAAHPQK